MLRRLAPPRAGRRGRAAGGEAACADGEASTRRAARQGGGHGRDRRAGAARAHSRPGEAGRRRRRDDVAAVVGVSDRGILLSSHVVHRRAAVVDDRAGGDLRSGAGDDDVPHAGRIGRACEQHAVRSRGERVDGEHQPRARHRAQDQGGRGVGELDEPVRRGRGIRRLSRERIRPRGWTRGNVGILAANHEPQGVGRGGDEAIARRRPCRRAEGGGRRSGPRHRPHAETVHRWQADASGSGLHATHRLAIGEGRRRIAGRKSQGHSQRRRSGARRGDGLGALDRPQPRTDSLLRRREPVGARQGIRRRASTT